MQPMSAALARVRARRERDNRIFAARFEAGANAGQVCCHNFITQAVLLDPAIDNAQTQADGQAACKARQLADLAAKATGT
jgi:hypothetical protein